ncbi:hypothetical protein BHE17_03405 [Planococcus maritimus]|nr:hypothetical protein BHE17_03405 [Planococcus maritimus]
MQLARQDVALPAARAWLEPPQSLRSLRGLKTHAIPAGVAAFRFFSTEALLCTNLLQAEIPLFTIFRKTAGFPGGSR